MHYECVYVDTHKYVCMFVCKVYMHACTYNTCTNVCVEALLLQGGNGNKCLYTCVYVDTRIHVSMFVYETYIHVCMYNICTHVCAETLLLLSGNGN